MSGLFVWFTHNVALGSAAPRRPGNSPAGADEARQGSTRLGERLEGPPGGGIGAHRRSVYSLYSPYKQSCKGMLTISLAFAPLFTHVAEPTALGEGR